LLKKCSQRACLGLGAGVGRTAFDIQTAFVADANGVAVAILAMCPDHLKGTTDLDGSVAADHIMVAATVFPTAGTMPTVDVLNATLLIRTHCRAVDDD